MREYPDSPRIGVGTVVFKGDRVLVIRRLNEPDRGKWSVPGGGAKPGERLAFGARREVMEECRVEVDIEGLASVERIIQRDDEGRIRFHYILLEFFGSYKGGEVRAQSDALEARWCSLGEVAQLDMPDRVKRVIRKADTLRETSRNSLL
jgi:ADP-ribose pyrophosphatase